MYEILNNKVCKKFGIQYRLLPMIGVHGLMLGLETVYPDLCDGENIKNLIKVINTHKKTHKLVYDGDTKKLLEKICNMRLTNKVWCDIVEDMKGVDWWKN